MFIPFILTFSLASLALLISFVVTEEIEALGAKLIAVLCLLSSLFLMPLWIKSGILLFLIMNHPIFGR